MTDQISRKDRMFQRLAHIVKQRFNTDIIFTDFSARLRVADVTLVTAVKSNPSASFILNGQDIVLPIRAGDTLFGFVTLFDGTHLSENQREQIRQVTDLM